jgi:hypothetical protein
MNFDDVWKKLLDGIKELASSAWKDYKDAIITDGTAFLNKSKQDLLRWTEQLEAGSLTKADFEWLLESKKDVTELHALKAAGLTIVAAEKFENDVLKLVTETIFSLIP